MASPTLPKSPAIHIAPAHQAFPAECPPARSEARNPGRRPSAPITPPSFHSTHSDHDDPRRITPTASTLSHTTQRIQGTALPASQSGGGTASSTPASSELDSASWSREESTLSSGDEQQLPPTRRPPFRGPPSGFPFVQFGARRDGRPFSGVFLPQSGISSRHSQPQTRLFRQPDPVVAQTSESGHSDNKGATRSADEELEQLWDKVDNQRRTVRRVRADVALKREHVRDMGRKKDEVDNAFMQIIRPHLTSSQREAVIPTEVMGKRFFEMQRIRDDYYANQTHLETLEAKLDKEEDELEELEAQLFRLLFDKVGAAPRDSLSGARLHVNEEQDGRSDGEGEGTDDDDAASRVSLLGIYADRQEDIHPLYSALLEAIGDREQATEDLDNLRNHRLEILRGLEMKMHRDRVRNNQGNHLSEDELRRLRASLTQMPADYNSFRSRFGVSIGTADLEFLQSFQEQETKFATELQQASAKVERLRDLCIRKGVMRKNAPYHEEYTIYTGTNRPLQQFDGNMTIDEYPSRADDLTHPKFPVLLSNPSHVLDLMSPLQALERAMKLPKDSPTTVYRRQECMKELGISNLMVKFESKPDYINQWLIHRLRTSPIEAELMLCVAEDRFKITNLRRWQEQVLYFWRIDDAAKLSPDNFHGPMTPKDELHVDDGSELRFNSVAAPSTRAKSDVANLDHNRSSPRRSTRSLC